MPKKILISILILLVLIFSHAYTYFIGEKKGRLEMMLVRTGMDSVLLTSMDMNQTDLVKKMLISNFSAIFAAAGAAEDIQKLQPICVHVSKKRIKLLEKYGVFSGTFSEDAETNKFINLGRERLEELCKNKEHF